MLMVAIIMDYYLFGTAGEGGPLLFPYILFAVAVHLIIACSDGEAHTVEKLESTIAVDVVEGIDAYSHHKIMTCCFDNFNFENTTVAAFDSFHNPLVVMNHHHQLVDQMACAYTIAELGGRSCHLLFDNSEAFANVVDEGGWGCLFTADEAKVRVTYIIDWEGIVAHFAFEGVSSVVKVSFRTLNCSSLANMDPFQF